MIQPSQVSAVIVGSWNPKIFTPAWIKKNLFPLEPNREIKGLVNFEEMDFGFERDGVTVFPKSNIFEARFEEYSEMKANIVSGLVTKVLELLPQTPIKALGINFSYDVNKGENIAFAKAIQVIRGDFKGFRLSQLKHSLDKEHYQVNIITDLAENVFKANFNFHYSKIVPFGSKFIAQHYNETQQLLSDGNI